MTINKLMQILSDAVRQGLPAMAEVVTPDELPIFVVVDKANNTVYITDVCSNGAKK